MRLSAETAAVFPSEVQRGDYDRESQGVGIVHFGIGAFHRAHQAWYTDLALAAGERALSKGWLPNAWIASRGR